eukprot:7281374-Prymnesium_polylepis.2
MQRNVEQRRHAPRRVERRDELKLAHGTADERFHHARRRQHHRAIADRVELHSANGECIGEHRVHKALPRVDEAELAAASLGDVVAHSALHVAGGGAALPHGQLQAGV